MDDVVKSWSAATDHQPTAVWESLAPASYLSQSELQRQPLADPKRSPLRAYCLNGMTKYGIMSELNQLSSLEFILVVLFGFPVGLWVSVCVCVYVFSVGVCVCLYLLDSYRQSQSSYSAQVQRSWNATFRISGF